MCLPISFVPGSLAAGCRTLLRAADWKKILTNKIEAKVHMKLVIKGKYIVQLFIFDQSKCLFCEKIGCLQE